MNRNRRFFHELTPFANALARIAEETPLRLSEAKDWHECNAKREAKLARRAAKAAKDSADASRAD